MTPRSERALQAFDRNLLRCASWIVPRRQRAEWLLEWESELWHAHRLSITRDHRFWQVQRDLVLFCLGAFQDAFCLRRLCWKDRPRLIPLHGSAARCLLLLGSMLLASYLFSLFSPGVRAAQHFSSSPVRPGTILIRDREARNSSAPSMTIDQVRTWKRRSQGYADGFAFYRVAKQSVEFGSHIGGTWRVAQASSNLFTLIGWSLHHSVRKDDDRNDLPKLVLSDRVWRQQFFADAGIVGSVLFVDAMPTQVVGIAPGDAWKLPGNVDAWLLQSDSEIASRGRGYVVAHLTRSGRAEIWDGLVHITSYDLRWSEHDFLGKSLEEQTPGASPGQIYWFGILLAFLALPALASVSIGEYSFSSHRTYWIRRAIRAAFLGSKVVLVLSIAYFSSIDLAYWHSPALSPAGVYIQLVTCFAICLFGMRWALVDQHRRCPVCLRKVVHPAEVGFVSRVFLDWSGTELMCEGGHTLLHVPALPTSWFSTQRWMFLDSSWDFLFAG